ncbi:hypothetical protein IX325_001545 [Fusobacterium necrophorum subsp. funduliforme]|uniref:endonuclease n=1 Tax=Fusobacterium necrophorum TaxID=859 RepID=UPI001B8B66F1|nr:endonuclease [Fusobacterium necrophorum]MBR8723228.1 hypothetical protein [Fusobacterium necrophorum subsp. funduliforme]
MLYKICGRCGKKIKQGEQCKCKKKRHRAYDREHRNKESAAFYHSKAWKELTKLCKLKASGLDLYQLEIKHRVTKGTLSHHIIELQDNRDRALDISNLIWISDKTHALIHKEYNKDEQSKRKMQRLLFSIIKKYL